MEIEFMTVVRLVTKGWRWLTCGALVGLALAILLLRVMTPWLKASASMARSGHIQSRGLREAGPATIAAT